MVVIVGLANGVFPVVELKPVEGIHSYVEAPEAAKAMPLPLQMLTSAAEGFMEVPMSMLIVPVVLHPPVIPTTL